MTSGAQVQTPDRIRNQFVALSCDKLTLNPTRLPMIESSEEGLVMATTEAARRIQGREREELAEELRKRVSGEVRFDPFSRVLYSTDASIYQMEPVGVVIPRSVEDVLAVTEIARDNRVPVLPRAGGTGLAGQSVNHAIVMDFSKYLNQVVELNQEEQWVKVQPRHCPGLPQPLPGSLRVAVRPGPHHV